jgi:hypothetical protein
MQRACQSSERSRGSGRKTAQVLFDLQLGIFQTRQNIGAPAAAPWWQAGVFRRPHAQFLPVADEIRPDLLTLGWGQTHIGFAAG